MPRPRSLDRAAIAGAALAVLDRDGPGGLTMRAVAAELRVSVMALYRYVDDREQVERWLVEEVLADLRPDLPQPPGTPWNERVVALVDRLRDTVAAHPAAVPLLLAHRHASPATLRWIETMLGVLADGGFAGTRRVVAQRGIVNYVVGALQTQHLGSLSGPGTTAMAGLPEAEFPHVADAARAARHLAPAEEFHLGLAALLRGFEATAAPA